MKYPTKEMHMLLEICNIELIIMNNYNETSKLFLHQTDRQESVLYIGHNS